MKTVIFDLDGTLVDSQEDITASINHVRTQIYGLDPLDSAFVIDRINKRGLNLALEFYGVTEYEQKAKALFEDHYSRQCVKNAKTFPGIPELLEALKSKGCDLYIATNAPSKTSEMILQNNNIAHHFTDIIGADRVEKAKPDPEVILKIVEKSKYDEIWMIGDSPKDLMAAQGARVDAIFVTWGYTLHLPEEFADILKAERPDDIQRHIISQQR
ncbi:HAD family hydrolase [Hydrogenimonas urashimensis]|uniref:HAD family hydrolase n=1 Tax=Hydrogenimonas urashimensis TaxID=2740515 RepID=UPI0019159A32|nr:HAD family hydrolase [Hydrogenimonas urashimensis]